MTRVCTARVSTSLVDMSVSVMNNMTWRLQAPAVSVCLSLSLSLCVSVWGHSVVSLRLQSTKTVHCFSDTCLHITSVSLCNYCTAYKEHRPSVHVWMSNCPLLLWPSVCVACCVRRLMSVIPVTGRLACGELARRHHIRLWRTFILTLTFKQLFSQASSFIVCTNSRRVRWIRSNTDLYRPTDVGYGLEKGSHDMNTSRGDLNTRASKYRIEPNTTPCISNRTERNVHRNRLANSEHSLDHVVCYCGKVTSVLGH